MQLIATRPLHTSLPAALCVVVLGVAGLAAHAHLLPALLMANPLWSILFLHLPLQPLAGLGLLASVMAMRATGHGWKRTNLFTIITALLLLPAVVLATNPLPLWGLLTFSVVLLFTRHHIGRVEMAALTLLLGALASGYMLFCYLPLMLGFSLFAVWTKRATYVALWGSFIMFVFHAAGYLLLPATYQPSAYLATPFLGLSATTIAALAIVLVVVAQSLYHWRWWPPLRHAAWLLGAPLAVLTLTALIPLGHPPLWQTLLLLTPIVPFLVHLTLNHNMINIS